MRTFCAIGLLLGALPMLAQDDSLARRGILAMDAGHFDEAIVYLRQALDEAVAGHAPSRATFPLKIALSSAYLNGGSLHEAEALLLDAGHAQQARERGVAAAELNNNWGSLHLKQGRYDEARGEFEEALRHTGKTGAAAPLIPEVLNNLAAVKIHEGDYRGALNDQREALMRWRGVLGDDHPSVIKGYANLATAQFLSGDPDAAQSSIETAIAAARRTFGNEHPVVADLLADDAIILRRLGRNREARFAEKQARRIGGSRSVDPAIYTVNAKSRELK